MSKKVIMRWNVLILMGAAYFVLAVLFAIVACHKDLTAIDAWNMLEAPLMALIGGTLAISKDLITSDSNPDESLDNVNQSPDDFQRRVAEHDQQHADGGHE